MIIKIKIQLIHNQVQYLFIPFIQAGYDHNDFYDSLRGNCDEKCLSIPLKYTIVRISTTPSVIGTSILTFLGFHTSQILIKYDILKI